MIVKAWSLRPPPRGTQPTGEELGSGYGRSAISKTDIGESGLLGGHLDGQRSRGIFPYLGGLGCERRLAKSRARYFLSII